MGQRRVRKGIVVAAVLEVAILRLVVSGISLWPERGEHADTSIIYDDPLGDFPFGL